jgi:hypothetical protein
MAAEGRRHDNGGMQPQMNANDANTSRRAATSTRGEVPKVFVVVVRE